MSSSAKSVPSESDLLCESCGYILNGLKDEGNCPECGNAIGPSTTASPRRPAAWEQGQGGSPLAKFLRTTATIIFHPRRFYRNLTTRTDSPAALRFARIHWMLAAAMFALAAWLHANWYEQNIVHAGAQSPAESIALLVLLALGAYLVIQWTTRLAARLTTWEGTYRGYRLPYPVVLRALYFHAAHFFPVALVALITVGGYRLVGHFTFYFDLATAPTYLYVLCGEVILAAVYLFDTYWIGMRNLMYANR